MRLAILGLGFMGTTHVTHALQVPGLTLAAVLSNDERKLAGDFSAVQGNLGGPGGQVDLSAVKKYRDVDSLLADPDIEAVDLCLPTDLHEPVAIAALRAGKHVLVEKPLALTGASADRIVAEAARSGRILMTAHVLRFWPDYSALRDAICTARYGPVRTAILNRRCAAPGWGGWLQDPSRSGGGAFDLLIHDADMALHLFGKPEAIAATGYAGGKLDLVDAHLYYAGGATVTITGGWHHLSPYPFRMGYTVTLDRATIEFSSAGPASTVYTQDESSPLANDAPDGYTAELSYFADCCRTGRQPDLCPPSESADAVKLMLEILAAREQNGEKIPCRF